MTTETAAVIKKTNITWNIIITFQFSKTYKIVVSVILHKFKTTVVFLQWHCVNDYIKAFSLLLHPCKIYHISTHTRMCALTPYIADVEDKLTAHIIQM